MAFDFPNNPTDGQSVLHTNGKYYKWDAATGVWNIDVGNRIQDFIDNLVDASPDVLNTLNELAAALGDDPDFHQTVTNDIAAEAAARVAGLAEKLDVAGGTLTGNLAVRRQFPDFHLQSNEEKRVLFTDDGGGATGAIKNVDSELDFFAGGVAAGDKKFSVGASSVQALANLSVKKNFPDVELSSGDEKRLLFSDAGGGATGAIKHVSSSLDFYAGGIASGNKEMVVSTTGVDVEDRLTTGQFNIPTTAPGTPIDGDLYFDKTALKLKCYVDDGSSAAWVEV